MFAMKHSRFSQALVFSLVMALPSTSAIAQCSAFVKKKCMSKILPFTHNGQMNSSTVFAGQSTELNMTLSAGQDYRILVCSEPILGEVTFRVMDKSRMVVFDSKNNNNPDFWDFKVRNTQEFIVHVDVPRSSSSSSTPPSGCLSIMVGFKKD